MVNDQNSAEAFRLSQKITEQELNIKEEAKKATIQLSKCNQYLEEITLLKGKILSLEYI
jgi:hypothetical protein